LISLLFMQLAVASYVCPAFGMDQPGQMLSASAAMPDQDMPGCQDMDQVQPSLCHAHGQIGNQSLDKPELPHVQPFIMAGLAVQLSPVAIIARAIGTPPAAALLTRTTAPPLAIRNCCFRI
jgi:hypothetical protein